MMKIEIIFVAKSEQLANSVVFHYGSICLKANTVTSWKIQRLMMIQHLYCGAEWGPFFLFAFGTPESMLARTQWWNVLNKAGSSTRRSEISSKALLRHWISKFAYAGESFWERCGFQIWHDVLWAESTAIGISFPQEGVFGNLFRTAGEFVG